MTFRFDRVLVDDRIIRRVPQFLGKPFYKKKKIPVPVNLTKQNLKDEVHKIFKLDTFLDFSTNNFPPFSKPKRPERNIDL